MFIWDGMETGGGRGVGLGGDVAISPPTRSAGNLQYMMKHTRDYQEKTMHNTYNYNPSRTHTLSYSTGCHHGGSPGTQYTDTTGYCYRDQDYHLHRNGYAAAPHASRRHSDGYHRHGGGTQTLPRRTQHHGSMYTNTNTTTNTTSRGPHDDTHTVRKASGISTTANPQEWKNTTLTKPKTNDNTTTSNKQHRNHSHNRKSEHRDISTAPPKQKTTSRSGKDHVHRTLGNFGSKLGKLSQAVVVSSDKLSLFFSGPSHGTFQRPVFSRSFSHPAAGDLQLHTIRERDIAFGEDDDDDNGDDNNVVEDGDNDDFGFLCRRRRVVANDVLSSFDSTAMHKAKSPSQAHKILPKKWRPKSKSHLAATPKTSLWSPSPQGGGEWSSMSGRRVQLTDTSLLALSEVERLTLQKIALSRLHEIDLGVPVTVPKDSSGKRHRRSLFHKKRTNSGNLSGLLDNIKDNFKDKSKTKDSKDGCVFNIPISKCIANDSQLRRRRHSLLKERRESIEIPSPRRPRKSSSSSTSSTDNHAHNGNNLIVNSLQNDYKKGSSDSLSESESSRSNTTSSLLDALSLSSSTRLESVSRQRSPSLLPSAPQVPYIVNTCFKHLETYGLQVLGIFRVGSSKKRTKQLRDEFDSGKDVKLNEEHNPHDVAALLKEFFRDLPEPLLTRDLYSPFVATRKLKEREKRLSASQMLVSLLPVANRDTLWALLQFLARVVQHSKDTIDENGHELQGNKMDSHNLATLFGPNLLHKAKSPSEKEFQVETMERAEERKEVIGVIQEMIEQTGRIFQLPLITHDEIYRILWQANPDATDLLLKKKSSDLGIEPDPDTCSSHFEESDTSSIPRSPNSDVEFLSRPKSLAEALAMQSQHRALGRVRSADTPSSGGDHSLHVPAHYRLSTPEGLLRGDTRSPSPMPPSPMSMSPSPQPLRHPTSANLRIQITPGTPEYDFCPHGGASPSGLGAPPGYSYKVPSAAGKDNSCSTLSSYYASTTSNSPGTPDSPGWSSYGSLPKNVPCSEREIIGHSDTNTNLSRNEQQSSLKEIPKTVRRNSTDERQRRTSSTQRPLGISIPTTTTTPPPSGETPNSAEWQRERWKHWEQLAKKSDDANELETLV